MFFDGTSIAEASDRERLHPPARFRRRGGVLLLDLLCGVRRKIVAGRTAEMRRPARDPVRARVPPRIEEEPAQVGDGRALHAHVHVVPSFSVPFARRIVVADVETAGKGELFVDDQQLAVIAHGPAPPPAPRAHGVKGGELHSRVEQRVAVRARQAPRAGAVYDEPHRDAREGTVA